MDNRNKQKIENRVTKIKMRVILLLMTGGGFGIGFGIAKIAEKISERVIDLSVSVTVGSMAGIIGFIAGNLLLLKFFDFSIE